jgi:hypothetical protein
MRGFRFWFVSDGMRVVIEGDRRVLEGRRIRIFGRAVMRRVESVSDDAVRCLRGRPSDLGLADAAVGLRLLLGVVREMVAGRRVMAGV